MAYDESLADRVRVYTPGGATAAEIRMFGGVCWTLAGHMVAGVTGRGLMIPVGRDKMADAIARGAREMQMGGRTMSGFAIVDEPSDEQIDEWVTESLARASQLPPKPPKSPKPRTPRR